MRKYKITVQLRNSGIVSLRPRSRALNNDPSLKLFKVIDNLLPKYENID